MEVDLTDNPRRPPEPEPVFLGKHFRRNRDAKQLKPIWIFCVLFHFVIATLFGPLRSTFLPPQWLKTLSGNNPNVYTGVEVPLPASRARFFSSTSLLDPAQSLRAAALFFSNLICFETIIVIWAALHRVYGILVKLPHCRKTLLLWSRRA